MNRRTFFTALSGGMLGLALTTRIPLNWLPTPVKQKVATNYLNAAFNTYSKRKNWAVFRHTVIYVGQDLFNQVESELLSIQREKKQPLWTSAGQPSALMFKGVTLKSEGKGWAVRFKNSHGA